jgi:hypothetical protein
MLYMKTRVTFRVAEELAELLRELPNQTQFVEAALRDALGIACPACVGTGRVPGRLQVQDFREARLPRIDQATALQLKAVVRLARQIAATDVGLSRSKRAGDLAFEIRRDKNVIMSGAVRAGQMSMAVN